MKRSVKRAKPAARSRRAATTPAKRRAPRVAAQSRRVPAPAADTSRLASLEVQEIESLRAELDRVSASTSPPRWNADPEDVRRSVAKLVLTLVEFIRQLLERQAIRRMDAGTLTADETESVGLALMRLEETVQALGDQFGLAREDLNLDLGPIGKLM